MCDYDVLVMLLTNLAYQVPYLLVCFAGVGVAAVNLKRCRGPAALALGALVTMVVVSLGVSVAQAYLIGSMRTTGAGAGSISTMLSVVSGVGGFVRAAALGVLVAAVFVGRRPRPADDAG